MKNERSLNQAIHVSRSIADMALQVTDEGFEYQIQTAAKHNGTHVMIVKLTYTIRYYEKVDE